MKQSSEHDAVAPAKSVDEAAGKSGIKKQIFIILLLHVEPSLEASKHKKKKKKEEEECA